MNPLSRRKFFSCSLGAAAAVLAPASLMQSTRAEGAVPTPESLNANQYRRAVAAAIEFQNEMMDAYATGNTVRLIQSYADQSGLESTAFTYDNAVSIHAYLLDGSADALARAVILGEGLVYAQTHNFPFNDGRFAQAYFVNAPSSDGVYVTPAAYSVLLLHQRGGRPGMGGHGSRATLQEDGNVDLPHCGLECGQLDREQHLQHTGAGRIFIRDEH